jgi:putative transposase
VGRRGYPPEFRRKVLDLVEAGRPIAEVAKDLGISDQSISTWRRQDRIDRGGEPGLTSAEKGELAAAKRRIAELETELRAMRRAMELVREVVPPKAVPGGQGDGRRTHPGRGRRPGPGRVDLGLPRLAGPAPSQRTIRHAWLTDLIVKVHQDSRGTYGALRVHAELRLGHGIVVGHNAIALLMRHAGLAGVTGRPKWRHAKPDQIAADLVDRQFTRSGPNKLWVTGITEHPTREGKVDCAVVLEVFSRRVVGWSIDASPDRGAGDQRARHGHPDPHPADRDDHPLRPSGAVCLLGVHPARQGPWPGPLDG